MSLVPFRCLPLLTLALLAGCGAEAPAPVAAPAPSPVAVAPAGVDWSRCQFPGLMLPVPGKVIVVDGGQSVPDAEPGRESIRRVEIVVPGKVALLLTAPDATVWLLRPSPETELVGVYASGDAPQRISGQRLGAHLLARSRATGDDCGRYWMAADAGATLEEASRQVFGRAHSAVYRLHGGLAVIGKAEEPPVR
ncbi:MAG: hypothetical protein K0M70_04160 [Arenimonas sp.]|uniref:hypothetical protein n=1 Tax=Arenimonas sp. TaxID=1872635 RepID=UPI0025B95D07|nr:hypothetical protein [Arenimonas sp.]MBW8367035.1 hypothetical protein [Arenimonas sp.]